MPYSSTESLPDYVKKLPAAKQRQWMHVFNSCMSDGGSESRCFAMANGVAKKRKAEGEEWEAPTGEGEVELEPWVIDLAERAYLADFSEEPEKEAPAGSVVLSTIEEKNAAGSAFTRALSSFTRGLRPRPSPVKRDNGSLCVVKQTDGRLRWYARYSNAWEDREKEILTEASHKEYIQWAYETKTFPELWLWHTQGTRFGEADWLEFSEGFAHASGLIDEGREDVVAFLASQKELGVSHGFLSSQEGKYVNRYRTFEISVLPLHRAAVWTSDFNMMGKEAEMAFTPERRAFLVGALGEEQVSRLEANTATAVKQLQELGVEYKETDPTAEQDSGAVKALAQQVADLTGVVSKIAEAVVSVQKSIKDVQKTDDEKLEDAFLAKVAKAFGQNQTVERPSQSAQTVVDRKEAGDVSPHADFLSALVMGSLGDMKTVAASAGAGSETVGSVSVQQ